MWHKSDLRPYQNRITTFLYEHDEALCVLRPGFGKTISALTAIRELIDDGVIRHALIVAPKRVARVVWPDEIGDWAHVHGLRFAVLAGSPTERIEQLRHAADRDITIIGLDLMQWLVEILNAGVDPRLFDLLVIDEISRLRNPKGERAKVLAKAAGRWRMIWGLSGTLRPSGAEDLFMPARIVTRGKLWGRSFYSWRMKNFYPTDYNGYHWSPFPGVEDRLNTEISPLIVTAGEGEFIQPEAQIIFDYVELPSEARKEYKRMERSLLTNVGGEDIIASSSAIATGKLAQMANGFIYDDDSKTCYVHSEKLQWLEDLVENAVEPMLLIYEYRADFEMLREVIGYDLPYLGAGVSDAEAAHSIEAWNAKKLPFMALHPACLHPSTEVLTEYRGWVKLIDVGCRERVFDGVEFVSHRGCIYSGTKQIIERFGIRMTPNHRLLIDDTWTEAIDVQNIESVRRAASYAYEGDDQYLIKMLPLRNGSQDNFANSKQSQSNKAQALSDLLGGTISQYDQYAYLAYMDGHDHTNYFKVRSRLSAIWRQRPRSMQKLVRLSGFLSRYVADIFRWFNLGAYQQFAGVQQEQLSMGHEYGTAGQQNKQSSDYVSRQNYAPSGFLSYDWSKSRRNNSSIGCRNVSRQGIARLSSIKVSEESEVSPVYDLVDCGPRNRFLIRNASGEVFISHNSGSHGLNLQHGGADMAWIAPTWSPELWEQTIARLNRSGQNRQVVVRVCIARDTIDQMKIDRVHNKMTAQQAFEAYLRRANVVNTPSPA
jgi:hypothetical protein